MVKGENKLERQDVRQFTSCIKRVKTENGHSHLPGHAEGMLGRYLRSCDQWLPVGEGLRATDAGRGGRRCAGYTVTAFGFGSKLMRLLFEN